MGTYDHARDSIAGLEILLSIALRLKLDHQTTLILGLFIIGAGVLQESMQFISQGFVLPDSIALSRSFFDLRVDPVAGLLGLVVLRKLRASYRLRYIAQRIIKEGLDAKI
jgi:hypothetical protein